MFGRTGKPLDVADIRHLSTARLKREVVRLLREANSKDDYLLARSAIDDILYRISGDLSFRTRGQSGGGGNQQQPNPQHNQHRDKRNRDR